MFLHIHIRLIYSILFCAIHFCNGYMYISNCITMFVFDSRFLLAALVLFSCILIGQFCIQVFVFITKFWVSHFCSNIFSPCFQWWKIGFVCSLVAIFGYLSGLFMCISYRWNLFCLEIYFLFLILAVPFCCQMHCTVMCAQLN